MEWVTEHGTWENKPAEIDMDGCPGKVYVRRNIHKETIDDVETWVCDMCLMTMEQFNVYSQAVALEKQSQMDATLAEILLNQMEV